MKFLSILAAASLALAPAVSVAGSDGESTDSTTAGRPISGPLAGRVLDDKIPAGALVVGGLVIVGGAIICILACGGGGGNDSNNNTNKAVE